VTDRRAALDAALRPFMLGATPDGAGAPMTARRVAAAARDAAAAAVPLLGEPPRSAHRVRGLIVPVLTCGWAEFDAAYAGALDALLSLPPAIEGVDDPSWDAALAPEVQERKSWLEGGQFWTPPAHVGAHTVAPGGTAGRLARRAARYALITSDGRSVRLGARCACPVAVREAKPEVPFEQVYLRGDGSILDVSVGTACGACRAPMV
jgi:hypothetical protein